ncbi:glycoside hydrolase domain-containing protein [Streptomyces sp. NPDC008313]|uniref:glycoside hydrolase domain-containing protein n=1 Tax=Streptomyces sp. NPDC008313 TaxID=3364826 RepID=UPI0036E75834
MTGQQRHRQSKRRRHVAWAAAGAAVLAGAGIAAQNSQATTTSWPKARTYTGRAFDACTAPSLSAMKAWHTGFYGAAAVYVGGKNRGCAQPNLTASWVKSVSAVGWKLVPIYVGAQPPCQSGTSPETLQASTAASQGTADGKDAVARASALGMRTGSALYLDMEPYDITDTGCNDAVLTYVRAWQKAVHAKYYRTGYYGFSSSSAKAVATTTNHTNLPGNLWYAKWDKVNTTTSDWPWDPERWTGHHRAHQYMVNSKESRGGYTITVDRDAWDAPVAITG